MQAASSFRKSLHLTVLIPPWPSRHAASYPPCSKLQMTGGNKDSLIGFQDFLPRMAERLGAEGLMEELCKGFQLLMDPVRGVITFESLKRNSEAALGLRGMGDEELMGMVREGDLNGDGVLDQEEFCVLMVRLSPELMGRASHTLFSFNFNSP